jgi:hypothetical protein
MQRFHGQQELFSSDHVDEIDASTIIQRCQVLDLDRFLELPQHNKNTFYSRYSYLVSAHGHCKELLVHHLPSAIGLPCICLPPHVPRHAVYGGLSASQEFFLCTPYADSSYVAARAARQADLQARPSQRLLCV